MTSKPRSRSPTSRPHGDLRPLPGAESTRILTRTSWALAQTWMVDVDAAVGGENAVWVVVADPELSMGLLSTITRRLLEAAVARLP